MKVLVCDDDFMITKTLEHKLRNEGYEVEIASDGRKAVEMIKGNSYDLILTDMLMPFVGGLELINLIRNQLNIKTPIIVLSKLGNEDSVIEAFKLGADDYITKPFSPNELSIRVKRFLMKL